MKVINIFVSYFLYFVSQKALMRRAFVKNLLNLGVRIPIEASDEVVDYLYDIYLKNKKIDKIMNRGGINVNMERMLDLVLYEVFFIRDYLEIYYTTETGHEKTIDILKKYNC